MAFAKRPLSATEQYQIDWEKKYQQLLVKFLQKHHRFDGSQVSAWMRNNGLHEPVHHNHWPTQVGFYAAAGWFVRIGSQRPTGPQAHIDSVGLWESRSFKGKI